jgi:ribonuclease HI
MPAATPHYLLFSEAKRHRTKADRAGGRWQFVLESVDGSARLEAGDEEEEPTHERLELLAVIRGLEAIPQPARVTLITTSRYVSRGLRFGLAEWRESEWQWEHFGQMQPVRNVDLWKRLDHAARIHDVQCRALRIDTAHAWSGETAADVRSTQGRNRADRPGLVRKCVRRAREWLRRRMDEAFARRRQCQAGA